LERTIAILFIQIAQVCVVQQTSKESKDILMNYCTDSLVRTIAILFIQFAQVYVVQQKSQESNDILMQYCP
jgi:hypothetical protein